jgi:hypothetical protein
MSFSFDFLGAADGEREQKVTPSQDIEQQSSKADQPPFTWFQNTESSFRTVLQQEIPHDSIPLLSKTDELAVLRRVRSETTSSTVASAFQNTDLVSGVYEGGLKVWECSVDLCRYFQENNISIEGAVLELGCGHGLPGCWVLKQARRTSGSSCMVVFSDFNEFVLQDATVANIVLNTKDAGNHGTSTQDLDLASWLAEHAALGAGDWKNMSGRFLDPSSSIMFSLFPTDGKFHVILAAETTYSHAAATDTAYLLSKHLKVGTGVAYIATKRYYFGVGGGSDCFRLALSALSSLEMRFHVETLQVFDNGAGNIRELLKVRCLHG